MTVLKIKELNEFPAFTKHKKQLAIFERQTPEGSHTFFKKLMQTPFNVIGKVSKENSLQDMQAILENHIPDQLQANNFYMDWVSDMAETCAIFCDTLGSDAVGFCLGTERGCRRYHIDNVPLRLLVTYAGQGTEWLPDEATDRNAFANGEPNEKIIKNPEARQFMNTWDIAIFRGGPKGLLHRTPDAALDNPSILMRLDHVTFWDKILKQQQENIELLIESA